MKKHNISRKKRTYKKYNRAQFRNFNKYTNLTSKMKGGVKWSLFGNSATWKKKLETLHNNIRKDTTFELAGAPLTKDLTKDFAKIWVVNAIQRLNADLKISEKKTRELELYITHYEDREKYERAYKNNTLRRATRGNNIPYSEMKLKAENLLQNINIIDYNSKLKEWLETFITFLDNSTYFSVMQEDEIMKMLTKIEKEKEKASELKAAAAAAPAPEEEEDQANFKSRLKEGYVRRVDADRRVNADRIAATEAKAAAEEKGATKEKAPEDWSFFSIFGNTQQPESSASESPLPESHISMPDRLRSGYRPRPANVNLIKVGGKSKYTFKRNVKSKKKRKNRSKT